MPFQIGANVGPYRVIAKLGQGGMATVFKAYHPALDRYVALKVLHPVFKETPQFLERFRREAKVVAKLEHPNIVPVYDFAEHEGFPYLVMKFIEGRTLKARMTEGPLSPQEGLRIARAVGKALSYAHAQGVLHRDVKPSNIMLADDGGIYLTDFGLARIAAAGESTLSSDMFLGTPQYISPEQAKGLKDLDARTDVYSFGIVLYEMVVGRVPFSADTPFSIIHDHIYTPLPLPRQINPKVPLGVQRVLLKALAKERADRFQNIEDLVEAFCAAVEGKQPLLPDTTPAAETAVAASAPAPSQIEPASVSQSVSQVESKDESAGAGKGKRRSWAWAVAGLVLLALCGLLTLALFSQRPVRSFLRRIAEEPTAVPTQADEGQSLPEGLRQAQAAVEANPRDPEAQLWLAEEYNLAGMPQRAVAHYVEAGVLWMAQDDPFAAAKSFATAMALSPPGRDNLEPAAREAAVQAYYLAAPFPEFGEVLDMLKSSRPDWPLINVLAVRHQFGAIDPENPEELDAAWAILMDILERDPEDIYAQATLAEVEANWGDHQAAGQLIDDLLARQLPRWLRGHLLEIKRQL